jgi:hypothetical protein
MDPVTYLTTPAASVGAPEWIFFVAQVLVTIAGIYLSFLGNDTHPVRGPALRRLGFGLLAVGLAGAIVGALRISEVAPFTMPLWITVATLFNLVLLVFALYYAQAVYPAQLAAHEQAGRSRARGPRQQLTSSTSAPRAPVVRPPVARPPTESNGTVRAPAPPSGRRESRRDRKRRNK